MLVGACLVLGGSQVVAALTGMSVYAACFLIPIVVGAYVIAGGLRSTFIADYVHTVVLFVASFVFEFLMYATSDLVGSPGRLYDLLLEASKTMPIPGNVDESYLSFRSVDGLVFAIDLFAAGFSTVCEYIDGSISTQVSETVADSATCRARPGILATSHRLEARDQRPRIPSGWRGVVWYTIRIVRLSSVPSNVISRR